MIAAFRLALFELRRFRGPLRRAALVVLLVVPSLYAGVYLWSSWNPYGHLDRIPVAVVNEDQPVTANGKRVQAGQDFVDQLKTDDEFDWRFVDAGQAIRGLKKAKYFFAITVPPDFSARLASISSGTPKRARMNVTLDDANGYIIGIIAATAQSRIQAQVNAAAQTAYLQAGLGSLSDVRAQLNEAADGAAELRDGARKAHTGARRLSAGLGTLQTGAGKLQTGSAQVAAGTKELADAAAAIKAALTRLEAGLPKGDAAQEALDALATDHPELADDAAFRTLRSQVRALGTARDVRAKDVRATVDDAVADVDKLNSGARQVASGNRRLATGIGDAHDGAQQLSSGTQQLADGAATLTRKLRHGANRVPSPDAKERSRDADVLANPVTVTSTNLHPAHVYGRGVAPFFLSIGLWVFGLVAFLLLRPIAGEALGSSLRSGVVAAGGWLPAAMIGTAAATIMFGVMELLLGLDADRPLLLLALLWLATWAFTALLHTLRAALDAVGSVVILVLLVLQLGGSGGLYPLQVAPGFFDVLHPILPMTYTIGAFRYAISGGETGPFVTDIIVLAALTVGALAVTTWAVSRRRQWTITRLKPELEI